MRFFLAALIGAAACLNGQSLPSTPDNLRPPATEKLARQVRAEGNQVYTCDGSKWTLTGPDAKLFEDGGKQVGKHFAGPTWEWSDGSRVVERPVANATPDPDSIPWLLLTATDHQGQRRPCTMYRASSGSPPRVEKRRAPAVTRHTGVKIRARIIRRFIAFTLMSNKALMLPRVLIAITRFSLAVALAEAAIAQTPQITSAGVNPNAASYAQPIAPGSLVSIFGTNLATTSTSATGLRLPIQPARLPASQRNTSPLLFVSPTQINLEIPSKPRFATSAATLNWRHS